MMPYPLNEAFLTKITIIKVFPCRGEHVLTYISGSRRAWWQKTTNRHTHTHTGQLQQGLIIQIPGPVLPTVGGSTHHLTRCL